MGVCAVRRCRKPTPPLGSRVGSLREGRRSGQKLGFHAARRRAMSLRRRRPPPSQEWAQRGPGGLRVCAPGRSLGVLLGGWGGQRAVGHEPGRLTPCNLRLTRPSTGPAAGPLSRPSRPGVNPAVPTPWAPTGPARPGLRVHVREAGGPGWAGKFFSLPSNHQPPPFWRFMKVS